ncbi:hypothetical protein MBLNU459_g0072t1 [Dothideomycetes sp. NU459]
MKLVSSLLTIGCVLYQQAYTSPTAHKVNAAVNATSSTNSLQTWWHDTGEINTETPVANGNVRQSHLYSIQVASIAGTYYNSFVYETIPGNGMTSSVDRYGETQAWTSFLYATNVTLKIARQAKQPGTVIIRPTNSNFPVTQDSNYTYISVPYSPNGHRFSVEFQDDLRTLSPSGSQEPWNVLLIFASPFNKAADVPTQDSSVLNVSQGRVTGLNTTTKSTIYFGPGVYYFTGMDHMNLSSTVNWIYFAPGSYVKGAVEYTSSASIVKATGHGVLSGEQYVFYADPENNYQTDPGSDNNGLRMWRGHNSNNKQTFYLSGPTINAAPFNSMDWDGNTSLMTTSAFDYKQVGSYYGQTDGLEMYPGSSVTHVFYHVNDDTIKTYYSDVFASDIVVWKLSVAPVVQFGWASRALTNITINNINVIHQSYGSALANPGLIGSDNSYTATNTGISTNHSTANVANTMSNVTWSNFRAEGPSACLFRIYALENLKGLKIQNAWIESFEPQSINTTQSLLPLFRDAVTGVQVNVSNFVIQNFTVGATKITASNAVNVGQIAVDPAYSSAVVYT